MLTRLCGNISAILRAAVDVVIVVHLVQLRAVGTGALNGSVDMAVPHQRFADLGIGICLGDARHDACVLEEGICVQHREELECLFKIIDHLLRRYIIGVACSVEGADAGAVLAPLVFPKRLVVALIVFPVYRHVVQQIVAVEVLEDLRNVFVLPGLVAELLVGSVAFIGPKRCDLSVRERKAWCELMAYHRPWTVQWSTGPVAGLLSQNCVCSRRPPG